MLLKALASSVHQEQMLKRHFMLFLDVRTHLCFSWTLPGRLVTNVTLVQHSAPVFKEEKHRGTHPGDGLGVTPPPSWS